MDRDTAIGGPRGRFATTRQSVVEGLRDDDLEVRRAAAARLVEIYWKPLYKHLRWQFRRSNEDAKDLIQGFFAQALERESLATFDPEKGTLRTFLRVLLERYAANERTLAGRLKRGGGELLLDVESAERELALVASEGVDADELLRREWIRSLYAAAVDRLRDELEGSGRGRRFATFAAFDLADGPERPTYRALGARLGVPETTVTNDLAAARRRFRALVLEILRQVTVSDAEFRAEARALLGVEP